MKIYVQRSIQEQMTELYTPTCSLYRYSYEAYDISTIVEFKSIQNAFNQGLKVCDLSSWWQIGSQTKRNAIDDAVTYLSTRFHLNIPNSFVEQVKIAFEHAETSQTVLFCDREMKTFVLIWQLYYEIPSSSDDDSDSLDELFA